MDMEQMKEDYERGQELAKNYLAAPEVVEPKMPYATYNWILFKCFNNCIKDFDNKVIDTQEATCATECAGNLKDSPEIFQKGHGFKGFDKY